MQACKPPSGFHNSRSKNRKGLVNERQVQIPSILILLFITTYACDWHTVQTNTHSLPLLMNLSSISVMSASTKRQM